MVGRPPLMIAPHVLQAQVRLYTVIIGPEIVTPSVAAGHELHKAARMTGGQFFQARDTEGLKKVYDLIDELEKKALLQKRFVTWHEWFPWLAGAGLVLFLSDILVNDLLRRRIP
jgi:Ca-activated chloride channel family protein